MSHDRSHTSELWKIQPLSQVGFSQVGKSFSKEPTVSFAGKYDENGRESCDWFVGCESSVIHGSAPSGGTETRLGLGNDADPFLGILTDKALLQGNCVVRGRNCFILHES